MSKIAQKRWTQPEKDLLRQCCGDATKPDLQAILDMHGEGGTVSELFKGRTRSSLGNKWKSMRLARDRALAFEDLAGQQDVLEPEVLLNVPDVLPGGDRESSRAAADEGLVGEPIEERGLRAINGLPFGHAEAQELPLAVPRIMKVDNDDHESDIEVIDARVTAHGRREQDGPRGRKRPLPESSRNPDLAEKRAKTENQGSLATSRAASRQIDVQDEELEDEDTIKLKLKEVRLELKLRELQRKRRGNRM
ncbi:hypothetical protein LTR62_005523 [Meristemomyces frigidus]|uniref:Uncharacterized protein n=1 Tax=Meristemomyces frigidus TaxID=1508187 RepID=A0AAN7TDE7_9PEZI|nr:hypothetical protein LTR62_005523 [Meristemomyces frigidus]